MVVVRRQHSHCTVLEWFVTWMLIAERSWKVFWGMLVLWGKGWCSQGMGIVQNLLGMRDFAQI